MPIKSSSTSFSFTIDGSVLDNFFLNRDGKARRNLGEIKFLNENGFYDNVHIERVLYNYPATIVFWSDHTKTVVKCKQGEFFDHQTGLAMAILKKIYGSDFHHILKTFGKE